MNFKVIAITLCASATMVGYSSPLFAETCYDVTGTVTTENVTSTLQIGEISLILSNSNGLFFDKTGSLVGNITGTDGFGTTFLSHKARFSQGDSFVTQNDVAVLTFPFVRKTFTDPDGNEVACSFHITEKISNITKETGLFKDVTIADITATGYVSNCPDENKNSFDLSGELCLE